jgi:exodeoxyribonuclease VII small subunit
MAKQKQSPDNVDFAGAIRELEEINRWFQDEEIDLDEGLEKLKRGKELIGACRARLKTVENEFTKIRDDFSDDEATDQPSGLTAVPEPAPMSPDRAIDPPKQTGSLRKSVFDEEPKPARKSVFDDEDDSVAQKPSSVPTLNEDDDIPF